MPPCAAIECARLGESWKQKHFTRYPSSPRVAAADPPARPEPTTMISNLRRLFGLTRRELFLWFRHLFSSGPGGTLLSSLPIIPIALVELGRARLQWGWQCNQQKEARRKRARQTPVAGSISYHLIPGIGKNWKRRE